LVKPEWGAKRACPKCNTRFYDLGKEDPVTCINCGNTWVPEPVLKSKQPMPFEVAKPESQADVVDEVLADDEDLVIDDSAVAADEDDLGGDDDLAEVVDSREKDEN